VKLVYTTDSKSYPFFKPSCSNSHNHTLQALQRVYVRLNHIDANVGGHFSNYQFIAFCCNPVVINKPFFYLTCPTNDESTLAYRLKQPPCTPIESIDHLNLLSAIQLRT
jgi:hypothetical protein